jgi:dienelactone hydrolase
LLCDTEALGIESVRVNSDDLTTRSEPNRLVVGLKGSVLAGAQIAHDTFQVRAHVAAEAHPGDDDGPPFSMHNPKVYPKKREVSMPAILSVLAFLLGQSPGDPARVFDYDREGPVDFRVSSEEKVDGVNVQDVSYLSARKGRVPGYLIHPGGDGPFAGIVYMHWGQGDRTEFLSEAVLLAKSGVVSLTIDAPYHRPDIESYSFVAEPEKERDGYIQLAADLRRASGLRAARKDVDPKRIGYVGHSLGATWGGALAGVEPRFAGYVLMGGLPRLTDILGDDSYAKLLQQAFKREQLELYIEVLSPINPELFVGRASPASILFQFARRDRFISDASARDYLKAAGDSHAVKWYFTSHEFNDPESPRDRMEFLAKKLGLSP